jgi:hypothetical protein
LGFEAYALIENQKLKSCRSYSIWSVNQTRKSNFISNEEMQLANEKVLLSWKEYKVKRIDSKYLVRQFEPFSKPYL